jgi:hypothetical protein
MQQDIYAHPRRRLDGIAHDEQDINQFDEEADKDRKSAAANESA